MVVAKRSLGPIIFISLQVEGERGKRMALIGSGVLIAAGLAGFKLRQCAASYAASSAGGARYRPKGLARYDLIGGIEYIQKRYKKTNIQTYFEVLYLFIYFLYPARCFRGSLFWRPSDARPALTLCKKIKNTKPQ